MSQYHSYQPQNDQSNYYIPLSFGGTCSRGESPQFFDPALCGNRVSPDEFKQLYSELKSTSQPFRSAASIYLWLCISGCLLCFPGVLIPILTRNDILLSVGIPIPLILYFGFFTAYIRTYFKKNKALASVIESYNRMIYHAKGLDWTLEANSIHLRVLPLFQGLQTPTFNGDLLPPQKQQTARQTHKYPPQNDESNYSIPLVFERICFEEESLNLFDSAKCGNRVSRHEFAEIYAELKATDQSFRKSITCYISLSVLSLLLLVAGALIPALTKKFVFFSVGIPVPLLLYLAFLLAALRVGSKKHRALESVLKKYNKSFYNAKGLHWALTDNKIHLSVISPECNNQEPQNNGFDNHYYHQTQAQLLTSPNPHSGDENIQNNYGDANQKTLYPQIIYPLLNQPPNQF